MLQKFNSSKSSYDLLLADEAFLRDFFENSPIGFHVFGPDQVIRAVNQAELDMLGYRREEIVGHKKWSDLIIPEQRPQFEKHWEDICANGQVSNLRYTLLSKKAQRIEVILNASARFSPSGKLLNTRGTVLDISHFRRAHEFSNDSTALLRKQKHMLEKHNQALNALIANIEIEKQNLKNSVSTSLEHFVLPVLRKLRRRGSPLDRRYLDLLEKNLSELTSSLGRKLVNAQWKLTPREIEICNMIKNDFSTKAIADTLCVSERTVEHHRNHIRKKLGLAKNNINLVSYLQSL